MRHKWAFVLAVANLTLAVILLSSGEKALRRYQASIRADSQGREMPVWEHIPVQIQLANGINFPAVVVSFPLRHWNISKNVQTTGYLISICFLWFLVGGTFDKQSVVARILAKYPRADIVVSVVAFVTSVGAGILILSSLLTGHEPITKLGAILWAGALASWSICNYRRQMHSGSSTRR